MPRYLVIEDEDDWQMDADNVEDLLTRHQIRDQGVLENIRIIYELKDVTPENFKSPVIDQEENSGNNDRPLPTWWLGDKK
jgi:hypothetical protein